MHWFFLVLFFSHLSFLLSQPLPLLLLISLHGFRYDYSELHGPLTNLHRLEQRGVRIHSMIPTFNTATIPSHYTLITGLYQEVHGVVSDQVYDRKTDRIFQSWANATEDWWPCKTIWTINEQREGARSGVIGWPQDPIAVTKYQPYRKDRSFRNITDQMLEWFTDSMEPINFGAIYFDEPGLTGYQTGPYSTATIKTVQKCDQDLGYLLDKIDQNDILKNNLHLILTSDHGLEEVNATLKPMYLEDYVDMTKMTAFGTKTVLNIFVKSANDLNDLMKNLTQIPHSFTYQREDIPKHYHYKTHAHIGDLIITLKSGYELHRRSSYGDNNDTFKFVHGNSGYDNHVDSMKTIFYASGPQLKKNLISSPTVLFYNVDVFPLMCLILNIRHCPSSNGSLSTIQSFLIDPTRLMNMTDKDKEKLQDGPMGLVIYLLVLVSFVLILIMAVVWSGVSFRHSSPMTLSAHTDPNTIAEQNQYKFTQINDLKLSTAIGNDNL